MLRNTEGPALQFWLFLPQMRMSMEQLVQRARAAEAAGFGGVAGMDHLTPPLAVETPMFEAMVTNTWVASRTEHLSVGSLVLCDSFRHPAVLARQAVSLDHASGGRFELGIGWGSVPGELEDFGIGSTEATVRVGRLRESLEIMRALWAGETLDYEGAHFRLRGARQEPGPTGRIPIVIGGAGRTTMGLVAAHADWWNLHTNILDRLEEMRPLAGRARCSLQVQIGFVPSEDRRQDVEATTRRRFGRGPLVGNPSELVDHFAHLGERGVERVYVWFSDFAPAETLLAFGDVVIRHFGRVVPG